MSSELFTVKEHIVPGQHIREYPNATAQRQEDELYLHVKQYVPRSDDQVPDGAVTIIGTHANGFPKELYEPLWDELLQRTRGNFAIRGIWIADIATQGQSYALNEEKTGNDPSWFDHSRDLLHIVNHFRTDMPRPLVGIGHSFGAAQLINLSLFHVRLFDALVLMDPVLGLTIAPGGDPKAETDAAAGGARFASKFGVAAASTFRRDVWPSRQAARASFLKSPFYRAWDPRVFEAWVAHGLRDLPTKLHPQAPDSLKDAPAPVTLATPKHQEVWTFLRPAYRSKDAHGNPVLDRRLIPDVLPGEGDTWPFYRSEPLLIMPRLPHLRPPAFFLFGETSNLGKPEEQRKKSGIAGTGQGGSGGKSSGRVEDVVLEGVGHLIPMEATNKTAQVVAEWLGRWYTAWKEEEEAWRRDRETMAPRDWVHVDQEWLDFMSGKKSGPKL